MPQLNVLDATNAPVVINTLPDPASDGGTPSHITNTVSTLDGNGAPFAGVVALSTSSQAPPVLPQRAVGYVCTASGNATFTFPDGSQVTLPIIADLAFVVLSFECVAVTLSNGAAASFWNLK